MANSKASTRVNGRNGEVMWISDDVLSFKTGGKEETMALPVVVDIDVVDAEKAREAVTKTDLVVHGAWTKEMPSSGGKTVYVVAKGKANCWVMEINKSQLPNARSFVDGIRPKDEEEGEGYIPGRVINTPLGALFTIGSIACVLGAATAVFTFNQPLLGIVLGLVGTVMWFNVK